jgi:hypothetical protein
MAAESILMPLGESKQRWVWLNSLSLSHTRILTTAKPKILFGFLGTWEDICFWKGALISADT